MEHQTQQHQQQHIQTAAAAGGPICDLAVVLRVVPYEERHRMVTALTRHHGRVTAIALNAIQSRRFGGALEPFVASEWMWKPQARNPQAEVIRLDEALSRRPYDGIRRDYARLAGASALVELFMKVAPEREPCEELFLLLTHALAAIEEAPSESSVSVSNGIQAIVNGVVARLLRWAGVRPATEFCRGGGCGKSYTQVLAESPVSPLRLATSISDAAWFCPGCRSTIGPGPDGAIRVFELEVAALVMHDRLLELPVRALHQAGPQPETLLPFLEALALFHLPGLERSGLKSFSYLKSATLGAKPY